MNLKGVSRILFDVFDLHAEKECPWNSNPRAKNTFWAVS